MSGEAATLVSAAEQAARAMGDAHLAARTCKGETMSSCSCALGAAWWRLHHALIDYKVEKAKHADRLSRRFR